ncbi:hypothetical protein PPL_10046 [Heterostelium album PN500]|uniref:Protein kinase domain-containing protein n=1 Tax=Heterostelium pallidum (strain ATCC 26659 / Pp 5 / PN500) TaxID=670386 RepID=D3BQ64_HETP5|nr:hypothetical protein PPL_10046 [Heterostelium album PN500]EFA76284.1 hypothetical protein PPL_10046 [Heterostelium album PN500]|eukprot:XP_020428416.1 hypothetical protein PPL_10046 [Heterostelium album PN500]
MIHNQPNLQNQQSNINDNVSTPVDSSSPIYISSDEITTRYTPPPVIIRLKVLLIFKRSIRRSRYEEDFFELERIGKGGYGSVYKVQNRLDGLFYALKKIPFKNTSQTYLEKVLREVKTLASLNHVNIVRYHSAWLETDDLSIPINHSGSKFEFSPSIQQQQQQQQQQHVKQNGILNFIDGNWGTSETFDDDDDDEYEDQTIEIDTAKPFKAQQNTVALEQQQQAIFDEESDHDNSLNRLQFPPEMEELQLFQKQTKAEPMFYDDDDESSAGTATGGHHSLFRQPKKHFTSFSLDEEDDDNLSSFNSSSSSSSSNSSNFDDSDAYLYQHHQATLIPNPPQKSTTPPISMPSRNNNNNHANNNNKQSPPKSLSSLSSSSFRITTLFIVMQLYSQTLAQWLENRAPDQINSEENLRIFKQICVGLRYIHSKGIIHRDLKPGNIFLGRIDTPSPGGCSDHPLDDDISGDLLVSLGDYGLATHHNPSSTSPTPSPTPTSTPSLLPVNTHSLLNSIVSAPLDQSSNSTTTTPTQQQPQLPPLSSTPSSSLTSSLSRSSEHCKHTSAVGTLTYSSPEQKKGLYNEKTDIYSLGIILFELYYPFSTKMEKARVLSELRAGILPKQFAKTYPKESALILSMMRTNPDERPAASDVLKSEIFGQVLSVSEMEVLIKQQQNIIEKLKQEIYQLKSPSINAHTNSPPVFHHAPNNDHILMAE